MLLAGAISSLRMKSLNTVQRVILFVGGVLIAARVAFPPQRTYTLGGTSFSNPAPETLVIHIVLLLALSVLGIFLFKK
jgi:hypothetical protein